MSDSENEFGNTPPDIIEQAANTSNNLLPEKSRLRYEIIYKKFMQWRSKNNVHSFSENVLMAYFGEISQQFKPSSLWATYSMLRSVLNIKHNINIAEYPKLRAYLKRQSDGFKSKKSKNFTPSDVNKFLKEAPDREYLWMKVFLIDRLDRMRYLLFAYAMGFAVIGAMASYLSASKDHFLTDALFRDMVDRMGRELADTDNYLDLSETAQLRLHKLVNDEQLFPVDYDLFADTNPNPSIRDQEYLEHSSLWGNQYVSGGAGEGKQRLKPEGNIPNHQEVKTDATLPAYCNPPNPCPIGYDDHQGCIKETEFENTAGFSRRYQAAQDCMCDTEHMFNCPRQEADLRRADSMAEALTDLDFNRFLQQSLQINEHPHHRNLVAKKYHIEKEQPEQQNPYLFGERLPVAAKKGTNVVY